MKSNRRTFFVLVLTIVLILLFFLHGTIQGQLGIGFFEKHLVLNYLFNYLITLAFYFVLLYFKDRRSNQLGFIFLFSSITKFILFFAVIAPQLNFELELKSAQFAAFFVPYSVALFLEIMHVVRLLNRS